MSGSVWSRLFNIGHTENLIKRLDEHNSGNNKSTKHVVPWIIVLQFEAKARGDAMKLENEIKKRGAKRYLEDKGVL